MNETEIDYTDMDAATQRAVDAPPDLLPDSVWWLLSDAEYEFGVARNHLRDTYRLKDEPIQRIVGLQERLRKVTAAELALRRKHECPYPKADSRGEP